MGKVKQTLEVEFIIDGTDLEVFYRLKPTKEEVDQSNEIQKQLYLLGLTACDEVYRYIKKEFQ